MRTNDLVRMNYGMENVLWQRKRILEIFLSFGELLRR